jgi:hypothetical protein
MPRSLAPLGPVLLLFVVGFLLGSPSGTAVAQDEPTGGPVAVGGGDALTIGGLLQTDAYLGRPGTDGFRIRTTRLRLGGRAEGLQYVVQTDFAAPSVLLDAYARVPLTDQVRITAGLFKAPFGREFLISRPDLLFAERSRAANDIPPKRQAGATVAVDLGADRLTATAGAFNGPRGLQPNDNDHLLYVGRLAGTAPLGGQTIEVGANAGYSLDEGVARPGADTQFTGTRVLFGADARLTGDRWLVAGEVNGARLDPEGPADARTAFGYYLAAGVDVAPSHQVLARFDQYDPDVPGRRSPEDQITLGYNFDPTRMLRLLLNYQSPVDELADGFVTARLQVALR